MIRHAMVDPDDRSRIVIVTQHADGQACTPACWAVVAADADTRRAWIEANPDAESEAWSDERPA